MRVWLDDDDPGLARTMAELDKRLRQAERTAIRLNRLTNIFGGGSRRRPATPPPSVGDDDRDLAEGHPS
jgi:hypothetical protein